MSDLSFEDCAGEIPLPFENDEAVIKYWGDSPILPIEPQVTDDLDEEVTIIAEYQHDKCGGHHHITNDSQRYVIDWFLDSNKAYRRTGQYPTPSWFLEGAKMNTYLDLWHPSGAMVPGWARHGIPKEDVDNIIACIRILHLYDPRDKDAVEWDHVVLIGMFNDVLKSKDTYAYETVERCKAALQMYKVLRHADSVAAEVCLRYHAAEMGAEFHKCWMFVGTREHIFALTLPKWAGYIPQHHLGSPAARKFREGDKVPTKKFLSVITKFIEQAII